jgi:hypothetical protein
VGNEPEEWQKAAICAAMEQRGWLANSFAQIEYLLGDLIKRCRAFAEYDLHTKTIPHDSSTRARKVRLILSKQGPLHSEQGVLVPLLSSFESMHETRHLLTHGFCEFHHTSTGEHGLFFQKFHRLPDGAEAMMRRTLTPAVLEFESQKARQLAGSFLEAILAIHQRFGWSD